MRCESCGQNLPLIEDDTIDLADDDEQELVVPEMNIQGQCDCHDSFHSQEGEGDGRGRCSNDGSPENGGLCIPCLFSCAS
jgi:hypothetical protein